MASSVKRPAAGKGKSAIKDNILREQDVLQAVIIAETFSNAFAPLSEEGAWALVPLVNCCLLDYALEALQRCGIQETFVFCSSYSQAIRSHIKDNWSTESSSMIVTVISSDSFMSLGDAIRELDSKALIRSDFVLINGHVVTTFPLDKIMEQHKKIRNVDKGCTMTLIYRKVAPQHRTRALNSDTLIAVANNTKKICFYQKTKGKKSLNLPLEVLQENDDVTVHFDISDTGVYICSPSVPPLYSDNFDYQTFDDLVKGLLINEEVLCSSMYLHVASEGYGASITDLTSYDHVSQDIIHRWSYPFVPDLFAYDSSRYVHLRENIYKDVNVNLHRNCIIKGNTVIGKNTTIGENTLIQNSIIGRNCHIGANIKIKGCYIWDNVVIADNCELDMCLLADNVALKANVKIGAGSVISSKVVIGDYVHLPELTKLQFDPPGDDDGFGDEENTSFVLDVSRSIPACDPHYVGVNGHGYLCTTENDSDDEEEDKVTWGRLQIHDNLSEEDEEECDRSSSSEEEMLEGSLCGEDSPVEDDTMLFYNEVLDSLQRGIEEKIKSENLILEINSSKYAYNITMKEVNCLVMKAILNAPFQNKDSAQEYFAKLHPIFSGFLPLIRNYIKNATSQMDCLQSIEEFIVNNKQLSPIIIKLLHILYDKEVVSELVIFKWFQGLSKESEFIKKQVEPFLKWLKEADEESSED